MSKRVVAALALLVFCAFGIAAWAFLDARRGPVPDSPAAAPVPASLPADQVVAVATEAVPANAIEITGTESASKSVRPGAVLVLTEDLVRRLPRAAEGELSGTVERSDARRRTIDVRVKRFIAAYLISKTDQPAWLVWPTGSLVRIEMPKESESTATPGLEHGRTILVRVRVTAPRGRMTVTIVPASTRKGESGS